MWKNLSSLKKYLIYNRISGSYNLLNWILTAVLAGILFSKLLDQEWVKILVQIIISTFWFITLISSILFIYKSFSIQKKYDKTNKIILYSILSLFIPFIFNFLIRKKLKPFKIKEEKK